MAECSLDDCKISKGVGTYCTGYWPLVPEHRPVDGEMTGAPHRCANYMPVIDGVTLKWLWPATEEEAGGYVKAGDGTLDEYPETVGARQWRELYGRARTRTPREREKTEVTE